MDETIPTFKLRWQSLEYKGRDEMSDTRTNEYLESDIDELRAEIETLKANLKRAIEIAEKLRRPPYPHMEECDCSACKIMAELQKMKGELP